jgi:hypothetical protein
MLAFAKQVRAYCLPVLALVCGPALAQDQALAIRGATVGAVQRVVVLNAQLTFALPDGARQAVQDGVVLTLDLDFELVRRRNWWLDDTTAVLTQHYQVAYHALSEHFLLRNLNSGQQTAHATLDEALSSLSDIRDLPLLDQGLLDGKESYRLRARATLDVRTLPETLRWMLFWVDDWRQRTDWYSWPLAL